MNNGFKLALQRAFKLIFASVLALLLGGCANYSLNNNIQVVSAEFGVFEDFHAKHLVFTKTSHVPWKVGQDYGWRIKLDKPTKSIMIHEELILPSPAVQWANESPSGHFTVLDGRDGAIIEQELDQEDGYFYGSWSIVSGDPRGRHLLKLSMDGKVVAEFKFDVD